MHRVCSDCIAGFYRMTILLKPVLPKLAGAVEAWLGIPDLAWSDLGTTPGQAGRQPLAVTAYKHLMARIDNKQMDALLEGPKAAVVPPPQAAPHPSPLPGREREASRRRVPRSRSTISPRSTCALRAS